MPSPNPRARFIEGFVRPMVVGGAVRVGRPLCTRARSVRAQLSDASPTVAGDVLGLARGVLARLGVRTRIDALGETDLSLAMVWHDLLSLTHPGTSDSSRRRACRATRTTLDHVGPARTARDALARHALLGRLAEVGRVDTTVTFWAGQTQWYGQPPPWRATVWARVRHVRTASERTPLASLLAALDHGDPRLDLAPVARAALACSPITDLAMAERAVPSPFEWTNGAVGVVAESELRGLAARCVLRGDRLSEGHARVAAIERATGAVAGKLAPAAAVALVAWHLELFVFEALVPHSATTRSPLGLALASRLGSETAARRLGLAQSLVQRVLANHSAMSTPEHDPVAMTLLDRCNAGCQP